jgi:hypothetical protein
MQEISEGKPCERYNLSVAVQLVLCVCLNESILKCVEGYVLRDVQLAAAGSWYGSRLSNVRDYGSRSFGISEFGLGCGQAEVLVA